VVGLVVDATTGVPIDGGFVQFDIAPLPANPERRSVNGALMAAHVVPENSKDDKEELHEKRRDIVLESTTTTVKEATPTTTTVATRLTINSPPATGRRVCVCVCVCVCLCVCVRM
jgi:hypothetical protein